VEQFAEIYTWGADVELTTFRDATYMYLYKQVMVANVCLEGVEKAEGSQTEKEVLRGQAAFTRAFAYLLLANLYAKPYNKALPDDLCVPVKPVSTPVLDKYPRATIAEVWGLITSDIQTALDNLKDKNCERNVYEISYPAALFLAARIALYMEDWDNVIAYGEELRASFPQYALFDIADKTTAGPRTEDPQLGIFKLVKFINNQNTELIWGYDWSSSTYESQLYPLISATTGMYYAPSSYGDNNLIDTYSEGDRRKAYWFYPPTPGDNYPTLRYSYTTVKVENLPPADEFFARFAFRISEVYLMLAEAYVRKENPDKGEAVELLNSLRQKRFDPAVYTPLDEAGFSVESLTDFVWDERRRELCFEELHRWWDLRRIPTAKQKPIVHQWTNNRSYTLHPGDDAYVLNFPQEELNYNGDALVPNQRPNRQPD
jgi:hypothetical protein